jgi:hypothetical protein
MKSALLALGILLSAPYQCATEPDQRPTQDTAPEALWKLAERFGSESNASARETTLRELVEKYPSSRYAERARQELGLAPAKTRSDKNSREESSADQESGDNASADQESGDEHAADEREKD